jgi:hypothetical protein
MAPLVHDVVGLVLLEQALAQLLIPGNRSTALGAGLVEPSEQLLGNGWNGGLDRGRAHADVLEKEKSKTSLDYW